MRKGMDKKTGFLADSEFSNEFFWKVVPNDAWAGKPCYIIGGGPSLEEHWPWLLPRLKGQLTIGINRAYEMFEPTIIFGMDPTFIRHLQMGKYGNLALQKWRESRAHKVWLLTYKTKVAENVRILKCIGGYALARQAFPLRMEEGIGHGKNSGYAALNLAACLGANPIYLLGYDMKKDGDKSHWHDGHPKPMPDHVPETFKKQFFLASKELKKRNITVINLNPKSGLTCFPRTEISTGFVSEAPRVEHIKRGPAISRDAAKFGPLAKIQTEAVPKKDLSDLLISGPYGFGDTFYLRSVVKDLAKKHRDIYIRTTLPEAFWDIENVKFVRPTTNRLRAQKDHIEHLDKAKTHKWVKPPPGTNHRTWASFVPGWRHKDASPEAEAITTNPRGEESTTKFFMNEYHIDNFDFSFPVKQKWMEEAKETMNALDTKGKRICIIRPPTVRKEWANFARNPKREYFQMLINRYKDDYFFITISNNKQGEEWFEGGRLKGINKAYDHGELSITTVFGLIKLADMVITPPDLFSLMAIAMRTKCFCIFGGCAKPSVVFDGNMGLRNFEYVAPEPFCNCMRMKHDCNKEIPEDEIMQKFEGLKQRTKHIKSVVIGIPPGIGDMHWVLAKLESFKEKNCIHNLKIVIDRNSSLNYSRDFLKLVPFIDEIDDGQKHLPFRFSIAGGDGEPLQQNVNGVDYLIELNSRLEHGVRIEDVLPEYDVNFNYPINNPREAQSFTQLIKKGMGGKLYLFYASSVGGNKNWCKGTWEPRDWIKLANMVYDETNSRTILMGAQWDSAYANVVKMLDSRNVIQNFTGKTSISEALGLLRAANFMVGFLSGLVILATRFKIPCVSFWPTLKQAPHWHDPEKFQMSWVPPNAKKEGYMPVFYGEKKTTPEGIFDRLRRYL